MLKSTFNTRCFNSINSKLSNKIIRSDRIDFIGKDEIEFLFNENIRTIIDLRKAKKRDSIVISDERFDYNICSFDTSGWDEQLLSYDHNTINDILVKEYMDYIEQKNVINDIARIILNSRQRVLIMCHHGKDRTGVVVAFLLMLAGCEKSLIVNDYALSSKNLALSNSQNSYLKLESNPVIMKRFIHLFSEKYGTAEKYLVSIGWTQTDIECLKRCLLRR